MPKIKTHKGVHKRIKISGSGKLQRRHAFSNHFLGKKTSSRKRNYGKDLTISNNKTVKNIKRLLGA
ncbi:50S ribosomal protein L35 [Candidatus Saccharibacteria bacterium CPR2]|nr:50S ribosomal protein L35 [Candidatus Saccharibacteria bacterium CPR2]